MNFEQAQKYLLNHDWYYQSLAAKSLYISYPMRACCAMKLFGKPIPVKYDIVAYLGKDEVMDDYLTKKSLAAVAQYYWKKQQKDPDFIFKLSEKCQQKYVAEFLALDKMVRKTELSSLENEKLIGLFQDFSEKYFALWQELIFLDGYDYYGEILLNDILGVEKDKLTSEELAMLLAPVEVSFLQKERLAILKLAEKIEAAQGLKEEILKIKYELAAKKYPWLGKELGKISNKFHWLENDYAIFSYLGQTHFFEKVVTLLADQQKMQIEDAMFEELKNIKIEKKLLIKKYALSADFVNVASYFAQLGTLRDQRKSYNQLGCGTIELFAKEFSRRSQIALPEVEQFLYWELPNIFQDKSLFKKARKRIGGYFYCPELNWRKPTEFYGNDAINLNKTVKNGIGGKLAGRVAFRGKVSGVVKIIRSQKDFYKMEKGDILIAPNTRPEYMPIMKMAGAIVTEEGGITCHAAIVSRELKIPCIVGVQGVTNALKDGDLVEVDAIEGAINKII